jgi:hypothetical protein
LIRRLAGVVLRPRATLAALVAAPAWVTTWAVILTVWAACGSWLLSTTVGQQALVDERVRVIESLGGTVSDAHYEQMQAAPPWWVYFTSGGRLLLFPLTTLAVAALLVPTGHATMTQAVALAVHASVPLVIGQVIATPIHYVRESLTSPLNLAAVLPLIEAGSLPARFFGTIDLFAVWWAGLLAVGLSVLTGQRASRFAWRLAALFLVFAAVSATVTAAMGGA